MVLEVKGLEEWDMVVEEEDGQEVGPQGSLASISAVPLSNSRVALSPVATRFSWPGKETHADSTL